MSEPRIALVTGGLAGIGHAVARQLAQNGVHVAIGARRGSDQTIVSKLQKDVAENVLVDALDVTEPDSVESFVSRVEREVGPIDILVNAAGVTLHQTTIGHSLEDWQTVIDTNLTGPFLTTRACLPGMIKRQWGRIVNIGSTAAHTAQPDYPAYCASKAGLLGLTRSVALEGAPHGVGCVMVSPTWVETDMLRSSAAEMAEKSGRTTDQEIAALAQANPQNRLVQPEEIAALVAFLCSDVAPALTMEDIQINAGAHW
jgi:NAD(P)-dependent dehydrogenase (short-subunit alcohol dehydrogenase family)